MTRSGAVRRRPGTVSCASRTRADQAWTWPRRTSADVRDGRRSREGGWYDACPLGADGETLLTVGDFGLPEADAYGPAVLIGALRGLALAGTRPGRLRDRLAELLRATALAPVDGAVYCGYRPDTHTLTWAHASGPAPLLFRGGTGRALSGPDGPAGQDGPSGEAEATLEAGDLLLLHTGALEPEAVEHLLTLAPA